MLPFVTPAPAATSTIEVKSAPAPGPKRYDKVLVTKVEHVVVPWTFCAMGRDGIELEARTTWTFTIRDGAIERVCMCRERREALEAAGLSE